MKKFVLLFLTIMTACTIALAHPNDLGQKVKKARNSFAFVMLDIKIEAKKCETVVNENGELIKKECDVSGLPSKKAKSFGSGTVVRHVLDKTYVLSAAHVCSYPKIDYKYVGHKIITVSLTPTAQVRDVNGKVYKAKIYSLDTRNDLCILKVSGLFGTPIAVAKEMPTPPVQVFSYAAPLAVNHPGMVLFFTGYTSGYHRDVDNDRTLYFYSLPIRSGSSGSSILNKDAEIVGVVHTAFLGMENIAIGTDLKSIQTIMNSIPEVEYKRMSE